MVSKYDIQGSGREDRSLTPWRTAHPYGDLDVIDSRAPRVNQTIIGTLALVAFLVDWWPLLALLALQLLIGLRFGRRYCLPCLLYFELIQPRFGEGEIEDSRPPRFANQVGLAVLTAASVAHLAGLETLGWSLGLLVASLALLAAITGFCAGCEVYKLGARIRGIRAKSVIRFDVEDLDAEIDGETSVLFTHPLCTDCRKLETTLIRQGRGVARIDIRERPDLARKYGVRVVPTLISVAPDGTVLPAAEVDSSQDLDGVSGSTVGESGAASAR